MRSRNIKPGFFKNEVLAECSPLARILFAGLWCYADRNGYFEWRPKRIKAELLPYDDVDMEDLLGKLQDHGFIKKFEVDGQHYGWIIKFREHQHPHHKEKSAFPHHPDDQPQPGPGQALDKSETSTGQAQEKPETGLADSLILNTDSFTPHTEAYGDAKELCMYWMELVQKSDPRAKLQEYDVKRMTDFREKESDRTLDEIKKIMRYAREDENFWKTRTPRVTKFIEHFPALAQQALEKPKLGWRKLS